MKRIMFAFSIMFLFLPKNGYCEKIKTPYIEWNNNDENRSEWPVMPSEYYQEQSLYNNEKPTEHPLYGPEHSIENDGYCFEIHSSKIINGEDKNTEFNSCNSDFGDDK